MQHFVQMQYGADGRGGGAPLQAAYRRKHAAKH